LRQRVRTQAEVFTTEDTEVTGETITGETKTAIPRFGFLCVLCVLCGEDLCPLPDAAIIMPDAHILMPDAHILGIESSCDETGAAVVGSGQRILSNVVASQIATHQPYGGVVPELASREHLRAIVPVVRTALSEAGQTYQSVDAIAVTQGPGLAGALLVGISYAKALAFALEKPLIGVNHLEGHIHAVLLEQRQSESGELQFPVLALVVSGGHTHLYLAEVQENLWTYRNIGHTRDDAAGEAFDKVAKLLGLGYPGGPIIDRLAPHGDPQAVKFQMAQIKHADRRDYKRGDREQGGDKHGDHEQARAEDGRPHFDFSYSGIKTAVLRYVETQELKPAIEARRQALARQIVTGKDKPALEDIRGLCDRQTLNLVASFQRTMVNDLVMKTLAAAREYEVQTLFVSGGVAANRELRAAFEREAGIEGLPVFFPSRALSTDNAAMIAAAAFPKFLRREFAAMDFSAEAGMRLR
jgi:N6-L-threonylcarbamoyladenine synthase